MSYFRAQYGLWMMLRCSPPSNRFTRHHPLEMESGRFMRGRQMPYCGWMARMTGNYYMCHNKHRRIL